MAILVWTVAMMTVSSVSSVHGERHQDLSAFVSPHSALTRKSTSGLRPSLLYRCRALKRRTRLISHRAGSSLRVLHMNAGVGQAHRFRDFPITESHIISLDKLTDSGSQRDSPLVPTLVSDSPSVRTTVCRPEPDVYVGLKRVQQKVEN
mmetsp:Transcript_36779/g.105406  ORF Transcript_36779/g.105406 Transcript_36779/m.105406 type:complete len:149 (-) Transcript_36779:214-660(-)